MMISMMGASSGSLARSNFTVTHISRCQRGGVAVLAVYAIDAAVTRGSLCRRDVVSAMAWTRGTNPASPA